MNCKAQISGLCCYSDHPHKAEVVGSSIAWSISTLSQLIKQLRPTVIHDIQGPKLGEASQCPASRSNLARLSFTITNTEASHPDMEELLHLFLTGTPCRQGHGTSSMAMTNQMSSQNGVSACFSVCLLSKARYQSQGLILCNYAQRQALENIF